ncbi:RNA polymerase sigma factor [Ruminococcus flavefaciens]|uniref:RNA polymerase sigma factor n=1 Tax=Ruminococcus flavefaciens TaxID=1265 RepID=UPI0026EFCD9D|nr:sigma-70 family RNA polymerase sigma factor [Ruminococcus flavefaciens]MDD7517020.1 sigma-70 family RNA polymerase sigma factor [Ruminococcus flavefaciens]MDY5692377.1 sigma-70 family RNA polymerase sigma factor [Ruminococcus flavefaciens]
MSSDMEKYYRENGRKVFLYLMTLCGNADTAEELTQETFYRALRSVNKYKGESSVYTWLCGIARNAWLEELRKRTRHKGEELSELTEDTALRPDEKAESEDSRIRLLKKIHSLPETEKELILLRASQELSFREIGEIFGKSENWARVTYYRAKQKLM